MDWELKAQNDMEDMVGLMRGRLEKLIKLPPTSIEQVKYNDAGEVISKSKVKGVAARFGDRQVRPVCEDRQRTYLGAKRGPKGGQNTGKN